MVAVRKCRSAEGLTAHEGLLDFIRMLLDLRKMLHSPNIVRMLQGIAAKVLMGAHQWNAQHPWGRKLSLRYAAGTQDAQRPTA